LTKIISKTGGIFEHCGNKILTMITRSLLITLLILHSGIHLLGFLKAYDFVTIEQLTKPINKTTGMLWLMATL